MGSQNITRKWEKRGEVRLIGAYIDEIVVSDVECFHLEQMDTGHWWIGINTKDGGMMHIRLFHDRNRAVHVNAETDDGIIAEGFGLKK